MPVAEDEGVCYMTPSEFRRVIREVVPGAKGSKGWLSQCVNYNARIGEGEHYHYYGYDVKPWAQKDRFGRLAGLEVPIDEAPELVGAYQNLKAEGEI